MKLVRGVGRFAISPLLAVAGALTKKPKVPGAARTPQRDDVADRMADEAQRLKRRGGAADLITGVKGAEAATGGVKSLLGS